MPRLCDVEEMLPKRGKDLHAQDLQEEPERGHPKIHIHMLTRNP